MVSILEDKVLIHSWRVPVLFESIIDRKKYAIVSEDGWVEVPLKTTYNDIEWIKTPIFITKNK
jgi:hypothetical protein